MSWPTVRNVQQLILLTIQLVSSFVPRPTARSRLQWTTRASASCRLLSSTEGPNRDGLPTPIHHYIDHYNKKSFTNDAETVLGRVDGFMRLLEQQEAWPLLHESKIRDRIHNQHTRDCEAASLNLAPESPVLRDQQCSTRYEWIFSGTKSYPLAAQSLEPILNTTAISTIREAAEAHWKNPAFCISRFTYQRPGNYEAHVTDLGERVRSIVNETLTTRIYPLIRDVFWNDPTCSLAPVDQLCVYDALYIRYNSTQAKLLDHIGAGQPLHRDLGLISINIRLNNDFEGGGTFFENQLLDRKESDLEPGITPLKPLERGHVLLHKSSERHAGASTVDGVRDILVFFVSGVSCETGSGSGSTVPMPIQSAIAKQSRGYCDDFYSNNPLRAIFCRIAHQRYAVRVALSDGEAWQYLGTAFMEYDTYLAVMKASAWLRGAVLQTATRCLQLATRLTPCDSRVWNNLALTLNRQWKLKSDASLLNTTEMAFATAHQLLKMSREKCDVEGELDNVNVNYGLFLSNQDRFMEAGCILEGTALKKIIDQDCGKAIEDAYELWKFCRQQQ